jgi:hypothetical protein
MPLEKSGSRAAIGRNIQEMEKKNHPRRQAIAAALATADRYAKRRAAGGSTGAPSAAVAPTAPTYATSPSGVLSSGLMPVPQVGSYGMDLNTGALTQPTQAALQTYAQRGLPITGTPSANPSPAPVDPGQAAIDAFNQMFSQNGGGTQHRGGRIGYAQGGVPTSSEMAPWYVRSAARGMDAPSGLIHTAGAGRTDNVPMSVAAGSHVIPADVMSGLGQGNTLAGAHAMSMALSSGPGGISLPRGPSHSTIPRPPAAIGQHFASGGDPEFEGHSIRIAKGSVPPEHGGVKCIVAGGEWILSPDEVQRVTYQGKKGHDAVDAWILDRRREIVKKTKALPGPVR